jgi:hypothetical protein
MQTLQMLLFLFIIFTYNFNLSNLIVLFRIRIFNYLNILEACDLFL